MSVKPRIFMLMRCTLIMEKLWPCPWGWLFPSRFWKSFQKCTDLPTYFPLIFNGIHYVFVKLNEPLWNGWNIKGPASHHLGLSYYVNFFGRLGSNGFQLKWRFGAILELSAKLPIQSILPIFEVNGLDWHCCLAGSSKTATRILIFSIAMDVDYSF